MRWWSGWNAGFWGCDVLRSFVRLTLFVLPSLGWNIQKAITVDYGFWGGAFASIAIATAFFALLDWYSK